MIIYAVKSTYMHKCSISCMCITRRIYSLDVETSRFCCDLCKKKHYEERNKFNSFTFDIPSDNYIKIVLCNDQH